MDTELPEGRFITGDDFPRHYRHYHFDFPLDRGLRVIADDGRIDIERYAFLHSKPYQRELLIVRRWKRVEIEHRHSRAIVGKDQRGPPLLLAVGWRNRLNLRLEQFRLLDIIVHRRKRDHARLERSEFELRRRADRRKLDSRLRQLERARWRRVLQQGRQQMLETGDSQWH